MRKTLNIGDQAAAVLDAAGNASRYITDLIEAQERRWRAAHSSLRAAGWTVADLRCACDVLNGVWMLDHRTPGVVAMELHDGAIIGRAHERHGIELPTWMQRVEQVRGNAHLAQCVIDVSEAFWIDTPGLLARLEAMPRG